MKYLHYLNRSIVDDVGAQNTLGVNVPSGFATNSEAYLEFLQTTGVKNSIEEILSDFDINDSKILNNKGKEVRELILSTQLPVNIQKELSDAHDEMLNYYNSQEFDTAIRFNSLKLQDSDFESIENSYSNIQGIDLLYKKVQEKYASLFTNRAIHYREIREYGHFSFSTSFSVLLKQKRFNEKFVQLAVA